MSLALKRLLAGPLFDGDDDAGGGKTGDDDKSKSDDKSKTDDKSSTDDKSKKEGDDDKSKHSPEVQALIDAAAAKARREGEATGKKTATELAKQKAEDDKKVAAGEWQKLAEERLTKISELEADLEKRDAKDLRRSIADKHNLPADAVDRLVGSNEAELDEDAKKLAKLIGAREAPDTEAGSGTSKSKSGGDKSKEKSEVKIPEVVEGQALVKWPD